MIIGVGIDVIEVARFEREVAKAPRLMEKIFVDEERDLPVRSLAARWAAKEALGKALGSPGTLSWHDAVVHRADSGRPSMELFGEAEHIFRCLGGQGIVLSLTHDAGIAAAVVIVEG